ncbi:hypothetical protein DB31_8191 [Hyalangium minutum]|uniref:Uncharacterized protein n=1 Tax=Hyalangium minutum TaxID=394096 RepID=A0A085WJ45_9BACT|nr:hypothetical protein DB31_8191 [Hyalangium minutum]
MTRRALDGNSRLGNPGVIDFVLRLAALASDVHAPRLPSSVRAPY